MACRTMCGCANPVGVLKRAKEKEIDPCWIFSDFALNKQGTITIPKTGLYQVLLASEGRSALQATNLVDGTKFLLVNFEKGRELKYSLGQSSSFQYAGKASYDIHSDAVSNKQNLQAGIIVKYVGAYPYNKKANIITVDEAIKAQNHGGWRAQRYDDNVDPYLMHPQAITPIGNWRNYPNNTEHWYILDVNLPLTQEYTVRVFGDDVGQVIEDGQPMVWANKNRNLKSKSSAGGYYRKTLTQGTHQFIIYNKQTGGAVDFSILSIKDAEGREYVNVNDIRIIDRILDCNNNPLIPVRGSDTIEWITKTYPIPCATVTYEVKKVNGVETSETRNTKNVTSSDRTQQVRSDDAVSRVRATYQVTFRDWFVDGSLVCTQEVGRTVVSSHRYSADHNSNDPDKSNNS